MNLLGNKLTFSELLFLISGLNTDCESHHWSCWKTAIYLFLFFCQLKYSLTRCLLCSGQRTKSISLPLFDVTLLTGSLNFNKIGALSHPILRFSRTEYNSHDMLTNKASSGTDVHQQPLNKTKGKVLTSIDNGIQLQDSYVSFVERNLLIETTCACQNVPIFSSVS